jgi:hypothetical protein
MCRAGIVYGPKTHQIPHLTFSFWCPVQVFTQLLKTKKTSRHGNLGGDLSDYVGCRTTYVVNLRFDLGEENSVVDVVETELVLDGTGPGTQLVVFHMFNSKFARCVYYEKANRELNRIRIYECLLPEKTFEFSFYH